MGELRQAHVMCSEILEEILTQLIKFYCRAAMSTLSPIRTFCIVYIPNVKNVRILVAGVQSKSAALCLY